MHDAALLHSDEDLGLTRLLGRHLVGMVLHGKWPDGRPVRTSYSAFVIAIGGHWHLTTAGHDIENWRNAVACGLHVDGYELNDA